MPNIKDYIKKYGKYDFKDKLITPVDTLIFSQLSYIPLEGIVEPNFRSHKLKNVFDKVLRNGVKSLSMPITRILDDALIKEIVNSKRFGDLKVVHYDSFNDIDKVCQFAALTYILDDGIKVVAFRGTTSEISAWRESLNMALLPRVPGQELSLKYLTSVMNKIPGTYMITGHSKGGNLAMYSALNLNKERRDRIREVHNFDGPGFNEYSDVKIEEDMKEKIISYIPQSSTIGILLNHEENVRVIKSSAPPVLQHNPYSIEVKDDDFIYLQELSKVGRENLLTFKNFLSELSVEEKEGFLDTIYLFALNIQNEEFFIRKILKFIDFIKSMDKENRSLMDKVFTSFKKSTELSRKIIDNNTREFNPGKAVSLFFENLAIDLGNIVENLKKKNKVKTTDLE